MNELIYPTLDKSPFPTAIVFLLQEYSIYNQVRRHKPRKSELGRNKILPPLWQQFSDNTVHSRVVPNLYRKANYLHKTWYRKKYSSYKIWFLVIVSFTTRVHAADKGLEYDARVYGEACAQEAATKKTIWVLLSAMPRANRVYIPKLKLDSFPLWVTGDPSYPISIGIKIFSLCWPS